jgi:hypothetical protein
MTTERDHVPANNACDGSRFCLMCHPRRALAIYLGCGLAYIGFLWVVFWWLP